MYGPVPVCDSCAAFVDSDDADADAPFERYALEKVSGDELAEAYADAEGYAE